MKAHLVRKCLSFALSATLVLPVASLQAQSIFPDKALEQAVRKEVFAKRYNDEPITKEDVRNISQVHGKGLGIKNLEGLQYCVAVQEIDLEDNEIRDISQMAGLKLLLSINLAHNKIESLEPLADLKLVQYLELTGNRVTDISPLEKMTNMHALYLSENFIKRVQVLKNMPKVWTLYLAENPVRNFNPLGRLKWLSSLDLQGCGIQDLDFLLPLTELKYVNLKDNKLEDLAGLVEMAKADEERRFSPFWRLYLDGNPLGDATKGQLETLQEMGARVHLGEK